jgi:predicted phosphodiesterase
VAPRVRDPELFGITEASFSLTFSVEDGAGPVDAEARVLVDGEVRASSAGTPGTRHVRVEGLAPGTSHRVEIVCGDARAEPDALFPGAVTTLPAPRAAEVASFATLNDLHFGEPRFGGVLRADGEQDEDRPGWDFVTEDETDEPYWRFMNDDAIAEINHAGVDATIIKGDIADSGRPEQFAEAARSFARLSGPHHAFLGNHDYYALNEGIEVDGYALLGQPRAPRSVDLAGWRLLLLETHEPGEHHGVFPDARLRWLSDALDETRETRQPTLVVMHHQPVPPAHASSYPNTIGIRPEHSVPMLELVGRHPQVRGVLIGHTHRNRVRHYPECGATPFVEVNCTKDYPGGWGHYRLFEDGGFRQEVRRTASERALAHSTRCRAMFQGGYRHFALGALEARCFVVEGLLEG